MDKRQKLGQFRYIPWIALVQIAIISFPYAVKAAAQVSPGQSAALQSTDQTPVTPGERETATDDSDDDVETMFPHLSNTRYWLSGQANFIFQSNPGFYAKYSGPHSLNPHFDRALSRVITVYTGLQLNDSTELLVDLEEAGGSALCTGLGLAGFTNLDIVRNPQLSKAPYPARAMVHKVFALSKDKIENQRNALSLFEELPRRRMEVRFGKFSMADFIDVNSAGSDTHLQFMNWTVDNNGAWDYAADTRGYTVGAVVDFEDRNWGIRFAEALMPKVANGIDLVWRPWQVHAENWEYELRRGFIPHKAGAVRALAYTNYANMGDLPAGDCAIQPAPCSHS